MRFRTVALPPFGQYNIGHQVGIGKEGCYLAVVESGYSAAYAGYKECEVGMVLGECDEFIYIGLDGFHTALHGGDGVALPLQPHALPIDGSKAFEGYACSPAAVMPSKIAAEDKDLVGL